MTRGWCIALLAAACLRPSNADAQCEVNWSQPDGYADEQVLRLPRGFPLEEFSKRIPYWERNRYDDAARSRVPASTSTLLWDELTRPVISKRLGTLGGRSVHSARYSPVAVALLAELGDGSYCPIAIVADVGEEHSQASYTGEPALFRAQGAELLSMRVHYKGTGSHQESFLFTLVDDQIVRLKPEPFPDRFANDPDWTLHHRGGGFCRGSLVYQVLTGVDSKRVGTNRLHFRIAGRALIADRIEHIADEQTEQTVMAQACDAHYDDRPPR
jgi:hypothetical protein